MLPLIDDIYEATKLAKIDAETIISEYAPGQYELTLKHQKPHGFSKKKVVKISSRALLRIRRKPNTFLTFLSKGLLRATFSRASNFCNNGCAPARAIIPVK